MIKQEDDGGGGDETPNGSVVFSAMTGFQKERSETTKSFKSCALQRLTDSFAKFYKV